MSNIHYKLNMDIASREIHQAVKLRYISSAKYDHDWHSTLHTHTCTELFYVVSGEGRFRIEESSYPVSAGDLIIINPNVEHTELGLKNHSFEYIVLGMDGLEFFSHSQTDNHYAIIKFSAESRQIALFLQNLLMEIEKKPPRYELISQNLVEILLIHLMWRSDFSMTLSAVSNRSNKECAVVRRYLDTYFKENITLDQLAALAHVNKYHMVHSFTREYGISPINYLISRRIYESRHLLENTDYSLAQISQMLGFSSPSYFSQRFKKLEGVSPIEYRKNHRLLK